MVNINRIGEISKNSYGTPMKIIEYQDCHNLIVEFQDKNKFKKESTYRNFKTGRISNPYDKKVCGVGYIGNGKYTDVINHNHTIQYSHWLAMLNRCYSKKLHDLSPTYISCSVCEEWHNFQNFAKWFDENYYEINNETMCLDKDILIKGNKVYSPDTCIFVPKSINGLFVKNDARRGKYPIGIYEDRGYLRVSCRDFNNNKIQLGTYPLNKEKDAFSVYKKFKEETIKYAADLYKDKIPDKLYDAMYRYQVDITD